jgi:hypothetical protein
MSSLVTLSGVFLRGMVWSNEFPICILFEDVFPLSNQVFNVQEMASHFKTRLVHDLCCHSKVNLSLLRLDRPCCQTMQDLLADIIDLSIAIVRE